MKKRIVALFCAILFFMAVQPAGFAASDTLELELNGLKLTLQFDPSEQFSNITGGNVQASFYTYLEGSNDLYELYMIFPRDVQTGTTVDPEFARQNAPESSVVLIVTAGEKVDYYYAGQTDSTESTDYAMTFESVVDSGAERTYTGTLSAAMVGMAGDFQTEISSIQFEGARFSFTMPMRADRLPEETPPEDTLPPATEEPFGDNYDPFDTDADPTPAPERDTFRV